MNGVVAKSANAETRNANNNIVFDAEKSATDFLNKLEHKFHAFENGKRCCARPVFAN